MAAEVDAPPVPPSATIRKAPKPPKVKAKMGRRPKAVTCDCCEQAFASAGELRAHECPNPKPMGRPRKAAAAAEPAPSTEGAKQEAPPFADPPHSKGYTRIFVDEHGQDLAVPITEETETVRRQAKPPAQPAAPSVALALTDVEQRRMIDEYGELDRRMQLRASDVARFEVLKRAIKSWFDAAPPDADGTVEGEVYLLHLSARERERRVRDMRELLEVIGIDALLELATVALGALEDRIGKTRVDALAIEARTGSRRIKAVPKHPAGVNGASIQGGVQQ